MTEQTTARPLARTVIACLARSTRSGAVAAEGMRWSRLLGADLVLLHVGRADPEVREVFRQVLEPLGLAGQRLEFRPGKPGKAIARAAAELEADLIVAGAVEKEGALTYYVGSVARQIARQSPCSVLLLARPEVEAQATQRWVISTRFDEVSRQMLDFAAAVGEREQPKHIAVVAEYRICGAGWALEGDLDDRTAHAQRQHMQQVEQERLADFLATTALSQVHVHTASLCGRVGYESAQYARREGADLLMAPAPQRLGFWDRFFQHGVEFALESLPCALFLYRTGTGASTNR